MQRASRKEEDMKRLLLLLVAVAAFAAFGVTGASAAASEDWLSVTPTAATTTDTLLVTGTVPGDDVYVDVWTGTHEEMGDFVDSDEPIVGEDGSFTTSFGPLDPGGYTVWATADGESWAWVEVTVADAKPYVEPPHFGTSYLCWNREMVNPVAYDDPVADEMWKTGKYLEPQAILGNVVDGTNIGAYHLVCNAPATMKITDIGIGGSGEVYNALALDAYHHAHQGDNDLNVYHIWK
jgi:hypothetical protein